MSEYVVNFGDKSSAFVGLAMAEAESHGATLMERVVRCRDCEYACDSPYGIECLGPLVQTWDYYDDRPLHNPVRPNGFCAYGKRKDA